MLFRDIDKNQKNTNKVRHRFASLSVEEANSATFLFHQFASIYNLPNLDQINQLTANLKIWDEKMSPSKTASELERANEELKRLAQSNARMSQEVEELESKKADKDNLPETFRLGPPVELHENKNQGLSFSQMISTVKMCLNSLGYEPGNICFIAPRKGHLEQLKNMLKEELDLESAFVNDSDFDFSEPGIVRLATTQSCLEDSSAPPINDLKAVLKNEGE